MHRAAAAILSHYSERSPAVSRRHVLARAADRALTAAADRGDPNAIEAVWQGWLRRPDDERWELLTRWRGTQPMAEAVFAAAGGADAARGAGAGTATQAERAYLTAELARRQDWPRLWRLALDLPLAETIAAARQLPARWQPPDENGRRLLTRLAAADDIALTAGD
jgi:hypothetical protein